MTAVDWGRYQACDAGPGKPCLALSGYVVAGDVTIAVENDVPHSPRKLRAGR